jgi:phosphatidate phosphatase APP1
LKRPTLVHFLSIITDDFLSIKASLTLKHVDWTPSFEGAPSPIQAIKLLAGSRYAIKIIGLDENKEEVFKKTYDSDAFGNFNLKIPLNERRRKIKILQLYEVRKRVGLDLHLGSYIPIEIKGAKKLVICDFDKTLVDTRYSTAKELYRSLTSPVEFFPTIEPSVKLIKDYIEEGYHPFILSASPHFYEDAIRDWLYKRDIYTAGIFLKDYREVFSIFEGALTPKDLKIQGLYKLNHLIDILLMAGLPDELALMGDNFESDPIIYATLSLLLEDRIPAWNLWKQLNQHEKFQLTKRQKSKILNKIYQLESAVENFKDNAEHNSERDFPPKIKIHIRKKAQESALELPRPFNVALAVMDLYDGPTRLTQPSEAKSIETDEKTLKNHDL